MFVLVLVGFLKPIQILCFIQRIHHFHSVYAGLKNSFQIFSKFQYYSDCSIQYFISIHCMNTLFILILFLYSRPAEGSPSPMTALERGLDLTSILRQSKPVVHKSITSFRRLRQEVFSELLHSDQVAGIQVGIQ